MDRKRLVGKPVLSDELKPELLAEVVDRLVGEQEPARTPRKPRSIAKRHAERRARGKKSR